MASVAGMVQAKVPADMATDDLMVATVAPVVSFSSSILALPLGLVDVHVMLCVVLDSHVLPPAGAVTTGFIGPAAPADAAGTKGRTTAISATNSKRKWRGIRDIVASMRSPSDGTEAALP